MANPAMDKGRKAADKKHQDDILEERRGGHRSAFTSFVAITFLITLVLFLCSFLFRDGTGISVASLLSSAADSLLITLFFTMFYALVVERAKGRAERKAQELMIDDLEQALAREVSTSTTQVAEHVEDLINKMLEAEEKRLIEHWPDLLPFEYFPPSEKQTKFLKSLKDAVKETKQYSFLGSTGRDVARLLNDHAQPGTKCHISVLDPGGEDERALNAYAADRLIMGGADKSFDQHKRDVCDDIYMAIVLLFDLRYQFSIEVRTHSDYLFYRSELTDDRAFIAYYVGDRRGKQQPKHPPTYNYTSAKGSFYFDVFRNAAQRIWGTAKYGLDMSAQNTPADLEKFLADLGAGDKDSIAGKITKWREEGQKYMDNQPKGKGSVSDPDEAE